LSVWALLPCMFACYLLRWALLRGTNADTDRYSLNRSAVYRGAHAQQLSIH
jgi:hypothetical protein